TFAVDPTTHAFVRNGAGNLTITTQHIATTAGFKLEMAGELIVAETLHISGTVDFSLSLAGANPGIGLVVNGTLALNPSGSLQLINCRFRIDSAGLVAGVQLSLGAGGFGSGIGLSLTVNAILALNTTGHTQTLGTSQVAPGFLLRLDGSIDFGFASASGFVE